VARKQQTDQLNLSQPSFFLFLSMDTLINPNARNVVGVMAVAISLLLLMIPITVHAQLSSEIPPPVFDHEEFLLAQDQELRDIAPPVDFNWQLKVFREDVAEFFTFDPVEKAELKLEHAIERQLEIDNLDQRGFAIPIEYEERRVAKVNEASDLLNESTQMGRVIDQHIVDAFDTLRTMSELNDIRILYSQLETVAVADQQTKERYNAKVNALQTWQDNCTGEFDIDAILPVRTAIDKIELQCPKLLELQEQFGRERIRLLVSGQI